jgi:predicted Rossmann fold flavoprotein
VFPVSDRAFDVREVLSEEAKRHGVTVFFGQKVQEVLCKSPGFMVAISSQEICTDKVIMATGGISYPNTGSTGDGLRMAEALGHTIVPPRPALVPLVTVETWPGSLAGISMDRVTISTRPKDRKVTEFGAILFTQDGIGGPVVLNLSRHLTDYLPSPQNPIPVYVDLMPMKADDELERQAIQWSQVSPKKTIVHWVAGLVPRRLAALLVGQAGCPEDLQASQWSKEHRRRLVKVIKALELHIVATRPMAEATVTRGGVDTRQIDPKTMESRICPGLFFAGEVLDVDGPCGGYNLQVCWSTGALAGRSAAGP